MDNFTKKSQADNEVTSLNVNPSFDADSLDVEELEHRFEMTLAAAPVIECTCPNLTSCGTYCSKPPADDASK